MLVTETNRYVAQTMQNATHPHPTDQVSDPGDPRYDRLFKVRKILDLLTPRFQSQYNTHEQLNVDEAMIPFKGRLSFKQYMKDKPTKCGIKVFVLSDAVDGYVNRLQIYNGKNVDLDRQELGLCSRVILELVDGKEANHPKIVMEIGPCHFSSPQCLL